MSKITTAGTIYIIAAPSGAGKTSLISALLTKVDKLTLSISHTTRSIRPGEVDGKDYFFINKAVFEQMISQQDFLEYATVFNHYYGTSRQQLIAQLERGEDVIFDIDWQGARQLHAQFTNVISIFILPPSYQELEQRLRLRKQDEESTIMTRMAQAKQEISHCSEFDYVLFNQDFEQCVAELQAIITAQRLKYSQQQIRNAKLLSKLLENG